MSEKEKSLSDFELIEGILNGHKKWYELLIKKYNQRLYRVAKGILSDEDEIEDAMQEAYFRAYLQLKKFEKRSSFATWLTRILINECLMMKRRVKKTTTMDSDTELKNISDQHTPEKTSMNKELKTLLESAIRSLPEKYRLVFILREIEEMNISETSASLDISETNVKARLSRAKEMLRENLTSAMPLNQLLDFNLVRCDRIAKNVMSRI
jgi:RNA polymerase sigma factor (sigma-70 family)